MIMENPSNFGMMTGGTPLTKRKPPYITMGPTLPVSSVSGASTPFGTTFRPSVQEHIIGRAVQLIVRHQLVVDEGTHLGAKKQWQKGIFRHLPTYILTTLLGEIHFRMAKNVFWRQNF